jgi:hypothetical protein
MNDLGVICSFTNFTVLDICCVYANNVFKINHTTGFTLYLFEIL